MQMKGILLKRAARLGVMLMALAAFVGLVPSANAAAGNTGLKIYELAGAGALAGATYRQDTIVLFNPTQAAITCTGCAIQTHSGTSNTAAWSVYQLPTVTIPAGGFYMISASSASLASIGSLSPIPYDYQLSSIEDGGQANVPSTQNIMSSTVGVIALTSSTTALTAGGSPQCGTGSQLLDLVGYGSTFSTNSATSATPASCFAGSGAAYYDGGSAIGRQLGVTRKNKCLDTFDNLNDFVNVPLTYYNSSSAPQVCPTGNQLNAIVTAGPINPLVGGAVKFKAVITPSSVPTGTGVRAFLNFDMPYYGSTQLELFDDGTHGDTTAGDGVYSLSTTIPSSVVTGYVYPANVTVTDTLGGQYIGSTNLYVGLPIPQYLGNNSIRILAWYGAGNLSASEYGRDTVILFNPSQAPIEMKNWSLQTDGATGAFTAVSYLLPDVTIPAGGYFAIAGSGPNYTSGSACTSTHCNTNYAYDYELKTLEGTETPTTNNLSSTAVTVALVSSQTPIGTCPLASASLVDLIGIGADNGTSNVTCFAGSGQATYTATTSPARLVKGVNYAYATIRKNKCGNTYNNAADFMLGYIDFQNSSSTPDPCPVGIQMAVTTPTATPASGGVTDPSTFTATVVPASGPSSTGVNVTADLSNLGLSATQAMYDDGTHGDKTAGDHVYSVATVSTTGIVGPEPGLIVTATDNQGNAARNLIPYTITAGQIALSSAKQTATVKAGDVATFPITVTASHGYSGILNIVCVGSPNTNNLGVPISTQCVSTPPELTMGTNATSTISLAIATGTTFSAGPSRSLMIGLLSIASLGLLTIGIFRRKHLPAALLVVLVSMMTLNTTACGKNGGLGNTSAAPGTYTYVVTATDSSTPLISASITFTVTVQ
ncbi:MAG: choice-of-anchor X domain-containing protein [Acidobacteriota bacterium]